MKGELRKRHGRYFLVFENGTLYNDPLSLKNCQAIERGYDLDELAKEHLGNPTEEELNKVSEFGYALYNSNLLEFKKGFQKALEILGDLRFTEQDIRTAIVHAITSKTDFIPDLCDEAIQSLQQNEWEVEVEMEWVECKGMCEDPDEWDLCSDGCKMTRQTPKFDKDGCLILKRVV